MRLFVYWNLLTDTMQETYCSFKLLNRLRDATRQKDTVVRFGGDEFIVVLEELGHNKAYALFSSTHSGTKNSLTFR